MPPSCPIEVRNLCNDARKRWTRNQDHHSGTSGIKINPIELPPVVETDVLSEWEYLTRSFKIRKNSGVLLVHIARTLSFLAQLVKE